MTEENGHKKTLSITLDKDVIGKWKRKDHLRWIDMMQSVKTLDKAMSDVIAEWKLGDDPVEVDGVPLDPKKTESFKELDAALHIAVQQQLMIAVSGFLQSETRRYK